MSVENTNFPEVEPEVIAEVLPAHAVQPHPALAHSPAVTIVNVFIHVSDERAALRLLGRAMPQIAAALGAGSRDEDETEANDTSERDEVDADTHVHSARTDVARAIGNAWGASLRAAIDAGQRRPRTPPAVLHEAYRALTVETFDGLTLHVRPTRFACLEPAEESRARRDSYAREARAETALRELERAVQSERDPIAGPLFTRVFGRPVGAVTEDDLGFLRGVFRGVASPRDVARALALVDRYRGVSPNTDVRARTEALVAYFEGHLGLAPEGFALNYVRALRGDSAAGIAPGARRATTDDLAVGDLVMTSPTRVAVIDRVYNLLSDATRIEVIELRADSSEGLVRATYHARPIDREGTFRLAAGDGAVRVAKIAAPL